ncbi:hypothetical protein HKD37_15G043527 [Glycine soja]
MGQSGPLGPSRFFLQKAVASGGSNLARLGELGGKLLPYFAINRGRSEEGRDFTSLKELGRLMGPLQRHAFRKVYGKILDLTAAGVFTEAVVFLAQYYDQPLRCFTFGDFQMVSTIEEFEEILGCPLGGRKPYLFSGFLPSLSKIAAVVGDSAKELDRMKQTRNGVWTVWWDLAAIDAFLAYHHSKESPVVAILADLFDTFDRRCEKNSARIVCCLPALCVWLVSHLFQQDTRHPCPLQGYRSCAKKGRVDWDQHLAGIGGSAINWFPRWKEGKEGVLFSCGDYPNVPLLGTRGYPMRGAPTEESLSPLLVKDLGAQSLKVIQRVHKAWRSPLRKDKELRGIRNGVIGSYHGWLRVHTRGLDWLSKLKVIDEENFEAPEEDEEVRALKLELGKARLAKEKFKSAATHIRKECTESKRSLAQHLEATEQSMLAIIGQYKEELNQSVTHEQKLVEDFAQVYAEKEARGRVIDALHQEETIWIDRFALTLNESQDLPRLLAKAKAMAKVCTAPEEIHGLINYYQHMIDLMTHIIRNPYPYGLPPDFTPRAAPEDVSQAPTFEGQLPPYADYPVQDDEEGDTYLGPLLHFKDPSPHELPQPNIVRHVPSSPAPFEYASNTAPNNNRRAPMVGTRRKEGDTHAVTTAPTWMKAPQNIQSSYQPNPPNFSIRAGNSLPTQVKGPPAAERAPAQRTAPAAPRPVNNTAPGASYKYAQHPHPNDNFSPIPMAYSELWPSLLENHLVVAIPGKVFQPPYPKWYDPGAKCAYHSGAPRHNIDSCIPFNYKVQHLISAGWLSFQEEGPNVKTNPLASHGGASMNAVEEDGPSRAKRLGEVATSRRFIYQSLQAACMVSRGGDERDECLFHLGESHDMETCPALEVSKGGKEEPHICMQSKEKKVPLTPKALVICFTRKGTGSTPIYPRTAPKPTPFAYQSNKAVPWKYTPPAIGERVATEVDSLSAKGNPYKYGLGYEPGMPGRRNVPSRFRADRVWPGRLSQSFTSAGMVSEEEVAAVGEEFPQDPPNFVQPCHPDSQVGNWRVISQSEVYTADSIYEGRFFEDPNNEGLTVDFDRDGQNRLRPQSEVEASRRQKSTRVLRNGRKWRIGSGLTDRRPFPALDKQRTSLRGSPEMAPRKLASKRSRKDKVAEGTSSAPKYDSHRFRSAEHQQRFEAIKGWSFLRERRVQLRDDEYTDFQEEIVRRRWASLVTPMAKFDPDIVLEFYANAWPTVEGVRDMRSWVRGQWIPFDADALSQFLGYPLVLEEGQECKYGQRRNRADGFDEEAIAQLLCIPGEDFARTAAGRRVRIMRTNMTTLTQIWMTLLLSNIQPNDHNSDLPLPKCQLVYAILTWMSIHVAQLIADAIYLFAGMAPTRHPLDPNKSNRALGFPALITGLCQSFGVLITPSKVIRPPITRAFIEKYCTQRQAQGDAPQAADAPPPHQVGPAGSFDTEQYLRHLVRQQAAYHRAHVAWPGDWPEAQAGEAPAEAPDKADEAREDEEMTDLLDFLGGSGAT